MVPIFSRELLQAEAGGALDWAVLPFYDLLCGFDFIDSGIVVVRNVFKRQSVNLEAYTFELRPQGWCSPFVFSDPFEVECAALIFLVIL